MAFKVFRYLYLSYAIILFVVIMLILLPFIILPFFLGEKIGGRASYLFLRIWAYGFSIPLGIRYKTIGIENVPFDQSYIYTCNHNSYMDSPTIVVTIPGQFRPLAKVEISKVPVFGLIYRYVTVMVDRSSIESRKASILALKAKLKSGISVLIFPEGTMNKTDQLLTSFYDGAFRLAIETQTPIVPVVLLNTRKILPRDGGFNLNPGVITTIFAKPIPTKGLSLNDAGALKHQVYQIMESILIEYSDENTTSVEEFKVLNNKAAIA